MATEPGPVDLVTTEAVLPHEENCQDVCAALYKDLKEFVQDDVTTPIPALKKVVHTSSCPSWLWWYFGLSLASLIILIVTGACLAKK